MEIRINPEHFNVFDVETNEKIEFDSSIFGESEFLTIKTDILFPVLEGNISESENAKAEYLKLLEELSKDDKFIEALKEFY